MKKLLTDGLIVTEEKVFNGDILIRDGKIANIGKFLKDDSEKIEKIDISGKMAMPGIIDAHTHFLSSSVVDDITTGSISGAFGGVTTFIDYVWKMNDCSIRHSIDEYIKSTSTQSVLDFSFHLGLEDVNDHIKNELFELENKGISSLKIFTTFRDDVLFPVNKLAELFEISSILKLLVTVHAEDDELIYKLEKEYKEKNLTDIKYFPHTRPPESEAEAVKKIGKIAKIFEIPFYVVHLSSKYGLNAIRTLRKNGIKVYCETRPHYLVLYDDHFNKVDLKKNLIVPPIRSKENQIELWKGIKASEIQTIASDHYAKPIEEKLKNKTLKDPIMGLPGIETMLPLLHHYGVNRNIIDYKTLVTLLSTNPAKIFGLYPEKGSLKIGTDADIVIFDPNRKTEITHEILHSKTGFTGFEGITVRGWPVMTFLRGELIVRDGKFLGNVGYGKFVKGKKSNLFEE